MGIFSKLFGKKKSSRKLRLVVMYDFGSSQETISENATKNLVRDTMMKIDWNQFHIVQLEDENDNALHVSGSLNEDGLASGFVTANDHLLMENPPEGVEHMIEILQTFIDGEQIWKDKYL